MNGIFSWYSLVGKHTFSSHGIRTFSNSWDPISAPCQSTARRVRGHPDGVPAIPIPGAFHIWKVMGFCGSKSNESGPGDWSRDPTWSLTWRSPRTFARVTHQQSSQKGHKLAELPRVTFFFPAGDLLKGMIKTWLGIKDYKSDLQLTRG